MRSLALAFAIALAACSAGYESGDGTALGDSEASTGSQTGVSGGTGTNGSSSGSGISTGPFTMASHPSMMQLQAASQSTVPATSKLRVVTFNDDNSAAQLETFASSMPASIYWTAIGPQYGITTLDVLSPMRETYSWPSPTEAGSLISGQDSDVENYLISQLDGSSPPWGTPDPSTVNVLFLPASITVSPDGGTTPDACKANILAWHTAVRLPKSQVVIPYVVVPDCGQLNNLDVVDSRTFPGSAEIVAALTNPTLQGWSATDNNHAAWDLEFNGVDAATACVSQQYGSINLAIEPVDLPFMVQRLWSNQAAANNQPPCLPAEPNEVFFNTTPVVSNSVAVSVALNDALPKTITTQGVSVGAGKSVSIPLDMWSEAAVNNWTVAMLEVGSADLAMTLDRNTGNNGTVLHLTITMSNSPVYAQHLVRITSTLGNLTNNDYLVVHD
jgi:hypothetical protein